MEARAGAQVADLVRKYGGTPLSAPALAEIPDIDPVHIAALLAAWSTQPPQVFIFQTGVGTKALFAATDALGATQTFLAFLAAALIVVRGPKPTAALRARQVRIDLSAGDPYTTAEVLAQLEQSELRGKRVVVQRYGETNLELQEGLEERGAEVVEIATYRWSLPDDTRPLIGLMDALELNRVDLVAFTSASQVGNLFAVAQQVGRELALRDSLNRCKVASIGPVCSAALTKHGVGIAIEAHPPKLGPFVLAINQAFG